MSKYNDQKLICEIDSENATLFLENGHEIHTDSPVFEDAQDCTGAGDAEPAIRYLMGNYEIEFRTVRQVSTDPVKFENVQASDAELTATARAIYHDSETDFTDIDNAKMYLLWQATSDLVQSADDLDHVTDDDERSYGPARY